MKRLILLTLLLTALASGQSTIITGTLYHYFVLRTVVSQSMTGGAEYLNVISYIVCPVTIFMVCLEHFRVFGIATFFAGITPFNELSDFGSITFPRIGLIATILRAIFGSFQVRRRHHELMAATGTDCRDSNGYPSGSFTFIRAETHTRLKRRWSSLEGSLAMLTYNRYTVAWWRADFAQFPTVEHCASPGAEV